MADLICDICSAPDPQFAYPCKRFEWMLGQVSIDEWAVCGECRKLIERKDMTGLALRGAQGFIRQHPEAAGDLEEVMPFILDLHQQFFANRIAVERSAVS